MKNIKYLIQFLSIIFLFTIYKILGLKYSLKISGKIFSIFGPFFRSKNICKINLSRVFPKLTQSEQEQIIKNHEKKVTRFNQKKRRNALLTDNEGFCEFNDLDEIYDEAEGGGACVTCYK